jgi:hypothetical protein
MSIISEVGVGADGQTTFLLGPVKPTGTINAAHTRPYTRWRPEPQHLVHLANLTIAVTYIAGPSAVAWYASVVNAAEASCSIGTGGEASCVVKGLPNGGLEGWTSTVSCARHGLLEAVLRSYAGDSVHRRLYLSRRLPHTNRGDQLRRVAVGNRGTYQRK